MARRSCDKRGSALLWIIVAAGVVMAIVAVVVLGVVFGLFTGGLRRSNTFAQEMHQKAQFHGIEVALEMFRAYSGDYPPSNDNSSPPAHSEDATPYGGAQTLAEALVGWDLLGYHPESDFRADGQSVDSSGATKAVYEGTEDNLKERQGPFIDLENANPFTLGDIYEPSALKSAGVDPDKYVICDVYAERRHSGKKTGMPILYYRADTSKTGHDVDNPDNPENIYNYKDNHTLLSLGVPGRSKTNHAMFTDPGLFYKYTEKNDEAAISSPYRGKSYILISAGKDGLYGTDDDIFNFISDKAMTKTVPAARYRP